MRVILSERAEADLESIADYLGRDAPQRARSFVAEIVDTCGRLYQFPERWPAAPDFGDGSRKALHGRYLIFYSIHPDCIVVDHIVHGSSQAWRLDHD